MATKKEKEANMYLVSVETNPDFCGTDICDVQFAHGKAKVPKGRALDWFNEHDGYNVAPIDEEPAKSVNNGPADKVKSE